MVVLHMPCRGCGGKVGRLQPLQQVFSPSRRLQSEQLGRWLDLNCLESRGFTTEAITSEKRDGGQGSTAAGGNALESKQM